MNNTSQKITISAKDIFEYIKCKAFYKQYISSGKKLDDYYKESYSKLIFQKGNEFEKTEVEKIPFSISEKSIKKSLQDPDASCLRIAPPRILKRKVIFQKF